MKAKMEEDHALNIKKEIELIQNQLKNL